MTTNIKIIHAHDFIKATPEGQLDFEKTKIIIMEIAAALEGLVDHQVILDTRKAQAEISITDLWHLAAELGKYQKTFSQKMAVICPLTRFDFAGFFALCAQNRGFNVMAFTSIDEALDWLIAPPDA